MDRQHILSNVNAWRTELDARANEARSKFERAVIDGEPYTALFLEWQTCRQESALVEIAHAEARDGITGMADHLQASTSDLASTVKAILDQESKRRARERANARING